MSMPGIGEWMIIAVAVLILFGAKKIPEFMKGLGKGMKEFKNAKEDIHRQFEDGIADRKVETVE